MKRACCNNIVKVYMAGGKNSAEDALYLMEDEAGVRYLVDNGGGIVKVGTIEEADRIAENLLKVWWNDYIEDFLRSYTPLFPKDFDEILPEVEKLWGLERAQELKDHIAWHASKNLKP